MSEQTASTDIKVELVIRTDDGQFHPVTHLNTWEHFHLMLLRDRAVVGLGLFIPAERIVWIIPKAIFEANTGIRAQQQIIQTAGNA